MLAGVPTLRTLTILLAFAASTVTGVGCQVFHEHHAAALRAGHWCQEPDGFGGMKFDATKDQTEKKIKLENCHTLEIPAAIKKAVGGKMNGTLDCNASLKVAGKSFIANCPVRRSARW
jgi:L-alanine-DL-glutamate epimerase-like enolase superfamily enzyme